MPHMRKRNPMHGLHKLASVHAFCFVTVYAVAYAAVSAIHAKTLNYTKREV